MPIAGRKPKPEDQKVNRQRMVQDWTDVPAVPFTGAPRLPKHPVEALTWGKWTRRWWKVISSMPHCILWDESDWEFAFDTATIAAAFHAGDMKMAKELRDRERKMGVTIDDRRDLRIRYVTQTEETKPEEVDADVANFEAARRRRLLESD